MPCRLFRDVPAYGAWNMAVDEATLESALLQPAGGPTLRWYQWSTPTLSMGYFQSARDVPESLTSLPRVRRLTGGGAILHDCELTYSLVFPAKSWPRDNFLDLVSDIHDEIRQALDGLAFVGKQPQEAMAEPFLCFERRSPLDLVRPEGKVVGSAQRKRSGALLQHGSILLSASRSAPHLVGWNAEPCDEIIENIITQVSAGLSKRWSLELAALPRSEEELALAKQLAEEKYGTATWNDRR
ncbi:lipoate--protein ligase family protein [bacterium]|nr:lipoate--protein ligase family protein [bacterium]